MLMMLSSLIVLKVFRANGKSLDTIDDYLENVPRENKFHLWLDSFFLHRPSAFSTPTCIRSESLWSFPGWRHYLLKKNNKHFSLWNPDKEQVAIQVQARQSTFPPYSVTFTFTEDKGRLCFLRVLKESNYMYCLMSPTTFS